MMILVIQVEGCKPGQLNWVCAFMHTFFVYLEPLRAFTSISLVLGSLDSREGGGIGTKRES
jgi:hypothetical protein